MVQLSLIGSGRQVKLQLVVSCKMCFIMLFSQFESFEVLMDIAALSSSY